MTTKIIGTGSCMPEKIVTNDDLAQVVETSDEWIRTRTGICERRIVMEETTAQLAAGAAMEAIKEAGIDPADLDIILVGTSTAEQCFPSTACEVQAIIGATDAVTYDISAACSGFIFALNTVHAFFKAGIYKTGLIIGVDVLSKIIDWSDRSTCVLFGDAAGAAVVTAAETGILDMMMRSDGTKGHVLACTARTNGSFLSESEPQLGYVSMEGQDVFKFAVKKVPESIHEVLEGSGVSLDEIKYFVLHQANYRMFEAIAKRLQVPMEKIPSNIDRYGNTSAATIPVLLDELNKEGKLQPGDKLILSGFGGGLTWGTTLLVW